MAQRQPGLTRSQHTKLGNELANMRDRLGAIGVEISRAYPNPVAETVLRAQMAPDK